MSARDLARVGLLYLRHGQWLGQQIVPRQWITESLKPYSDTRSWGRGGYGMLWWVALNKRVIRDVEVSDNAFAGTGFGGHYLVMIPDLDLVVVHRVNAQRVGDEQFSALLKLILDAKIKS